jgi:WD40 repeat protein
VKEPEYDYADAVSIDESGSIESYLSKGTSKSFGLLIDSKSLDCLKPEDEPKVTVTNLDTQEKWRIDRLPPEHLTLETFDKAQETWSEQVKADSRGDPEEKAEHSAEQIARKEGEGWFSKIFKSQESPVAPESKPAKESRSKDPQIVKIRLHKKSESDFAPLRLVQEVLVDSGPIWAMKYSPDGNYLASAGSDGVVRIWSVSGSPADIEVTELRARDEEKARMSGTAPAGKGTPGTVINNAPFREFRGHASDVVDLSWSPANFLLSASLDKTVRLWHVSKDKCLCKFQHTDFVTSVCFHPTQVRLFLTGSYDRILRVWNILEHRVENWAQADAVITSASFSPDGKLAVAGLSTGQCVFYRAEGLPYFTQIDCRNRHGKFSKGRKVTGLAFLPDSQHLLVTTCDSRLRLFDMDDKTVRLKFKGQENERLPIRASFSEDGKHVICGSENENVYIWHSSKDPEQPPQKTNFLKSKMSDRSDKSSSYEYFRGKLMILDFFLISSAHPEATTVAIFTPRAAIEFSQSNAKHFRKVRQIIASAGFDGSIRFIESSPPSK